MKRKHPEFTIELYRPVVDNGTFSPHIKVFERGRRPDCIDFEVESPEGAQFTLDQAMEWARLSVDLNSYYPSEPAVFLQQKIDELLRTMQRVE